MSGGPNFDDKFSTLVARGDAQFNLLSIKEDEPRKLAVREFLKQHWGFTKDEIAYIEQKVPDLRCRVILADGEITNFTTFAVEQRRKLNLPIVFSFNCQVVVVTETDTVEQIVSDYRERVNKPLNH